MRSDDAACDAAFGSVAIVDVTVHTVVRLASRGRGPDDCEAGWHRAHVVAQSAAA